MRAVKTRCCQTVRYSNNRGSSEKKASCRLAAMGLCARASPAMRAEPRVAGMMPDKQRSVVVLPAPFGPTNPRTLPGRTVNDKSLTAGNLSYSLVNPSTSIMASGTEGVGQTGRTHLAGKLPSPRQAVKLNRPSPPGRVFETSTTRPKEVFSFSSRRQGSAGSALQSEALTVAVGLSRLQPTGSVGKDRASRSDA